MHLPTVNSCKGIQIKNLPYLNTSTPGNAFPVVWKKERCVIITTIDDAKSAWMTHTPDWIPLHCLSRGILTPAKSLRFCYLVALLLEHIFPPGLNVPTSPDMRA